MIQYNHLFKCGTLYIDTPSKEELVALVTNHQGSIPIKTGFTVRYYKDQFNKRIGRMEAENNIKLETFHITNIKITQSKNIYTLHSDINHNNKLYSVRIVLTSVPTSDRVYLIDAGFYG